jgi:8-oxo-dGTP pyrophosphatase MutT (NUDIX family)
LANWTVECRDCANGSSTVGDVYLMTGELIIPRDAPNDLIRAAGGIVTRFIAGGRVEVACIFRESRGDWTFPKGKLDEGETFEQAALREVHEETGMRCDVVRFVGTTNYTHRKGKPKIVAYYLMSVDRGEFAPTEEVDELVWLALEQVRAHLTWDRDQELFDVVVTLPEIRAQAS